MGEATYPNKTPCSQKLRLRYIGFLLLPYSREFPRIVGSSGKRSICPMACERFIKPGTRTERDGPLNFDRTLKGCWGLLRGHEDDNRLVEAPRHAGEGAAVVRVDDEEERPAGERVQIAGVKAAAEGKGKCGE